jgi:hypothetical protein
VGYRLKGGRPKIMRQGTYWVQRHRDEARLHNRDEEAVPSFERAGPDALGWVFIVGISFLILYALS